MQLDLTGKKILIGGGSRGIGLGIARLFSASGCEVAVAARGKEALDTAKREIGPSLLTFATDLIEPADCTRLIGDLEAQWGRLDTLITCAGSGASVPPGQENSEEWQRVLKINLFTATNLMTAATPLLTRSAPASIVCIASICGLEALGAPVTYSAAKAALLMTVKGLAPSLARAGVRINAISPGNIMFPGGTWERRQQENPGAVQAMLDSKIAQRRFGTAEEIAAAVAFLASPHASFITGANLVVDGGQTASI